MKETCRDTLAQQVCLRAYIDGALVPDFQSYLDEQTMDPYVSVGDEERQEFRGLVVDAVCVSASLLGDSRVPKLRTTVKLLWHLYLYIT